MVAHLCCCQVDDHVYLLQVDFQDLDQEIKKSRNRDHRVRIVHAPGSLPSHPRHDVVGLGFGLMLGLVLGLECERRSCEIGLGLELGLGLGFELFLL